MNVIEALESDNIFRRLFPDGLETWKRWRVFLKAYDGLPLDEDELAIFREHTGRQIYNPPYPELCAIVARQSGKTRVASLFVDFEALRAERKPGHPSPRVVLVAQDFRNSLRTAFDYCASPFEVVPALRQSLEKKTSDTLLLTNGVSISAYPCVPEAMRGLTGSPLIVLDEFAHYRTSEGRMADREMLRSVRPCLAVSRGKLVILSSPYHQAGALWQLHRDHWGRDESRTLIWKGTVEQMNPTIDPDYVTRMRLEDPIAAASELDAEFRQGTSGLLDSDAIDAVVVPDRRELPPIEGTFYRGFFDPSGGRKDPATLAIAHKEKDTAVIDVLRAWPSPHSPSSVIAEACDLMKTYRISKVVGDRFGGELPREQFRSLGIHYEVSEADRSTLYLAFVGTVNSGRVLLPDDKDLQRELRMLERKRGPSGKDRVDHPVGGADDRANVIAGVAYLITQRYTHDWSKDIGITCGSAGEQHFRDSSRAILALHDRARQAWPSQFAYTCGGQFIETHSQNGCVLCRSRMAELEARTKVAQA